MATIDALAQWLLARDDIALIGHVFPDGDAAGATIAIKLALDSLGKRSFVCLPGGMPSLYDFLPGREFVSDVGNAPFDPKCALAVDVADLNRLGAAQALFERCSERAVLDHHATNPGYAQLNVVDSTCAAACELVLDLIEIMGAKLTVEIAECLFVGISADSGNFNYSNTTGRTLRVAAKCVDAGADTEHLTRLLYRTRSVGRVKLLGKVLNDLEVLACGQIAYARVTDDMFESCGAIRGDTEGIVNFLSEMEGVQISFLAQQMGRKTKFSIRSVEPYDIADGVAKPLGGGGHAHAAGVTLEMPLERAIEAILERIHCLLEGAVKS